MTNAAVLCTTHLIKNAKIIVYYQNAGTNAHIHTFTLQSGIRDIDGLYTDNSWANVRCLKDI